MTNSDGREYRALLFSVAYRMLGNRADAEDAVQEAFTRLQRADATAIHSLRRYLTTVVTRICLDQLKSARARREEAVDSLPEPLPANEEPAELAESLSIAFLSLLHALTPTERAVFLLREVFEHDYGEIARAVGRSEANCRQILKRAKTHIAAGRPRFRASPRQADALVAKFATACENGRVDDLIELLADDVTFRSDGGTQRPGYGKARALHKPVSGAETVARFLIAVQRQAPEDCTTHIETVNGGPALVTYLNRAVQSVICFELTPSTIHAIYVLNDPSKLSMFNERTG